MDELVDELGDELGDELVDELVDELGSVVFEFELVIELCVVDILGLTA